MNIDEEWMYEALALANKAEQQGEVPVGALVVLENERIGEGWNQPISNHDPTAHAEVMALRDAGQHVRNYRLCEATLYVTLEPCAMCAGAVIHSRIKRLVFGAYDSKSGAAGSVINLLENNQLNHQVEVQGGVIEMDCAKSLQSFFQQRR